jgi:hypothetical protein
MSHRPSSQHQHTHRHVADEEGQEEHPDEKEQHGHQEEAKAAAGARADDDPPIRAFTELGRQTPGTWKGPAEVGQPPPDDAGVGAVAPA